MFRLDHRFSDATTLFVRANIDEADYLLPYSPSSGQYLNEQEELTSYPVNSVIALSHVFSPTLLNDSKFGFNRGTTDTIYLNPTGSLYAISVAGLTSLNNGRVSTGVGNTFAGIDDLTWVKGRHVIKAGVEVRRVQMNQGGSSYGTVSFNSLTSFAANQSYKASITGTYPVNGLRKTDFFGYFQDEFKWRPNLTLNLGVRYSISVFLVKYMAAAILLILPPADRGLLWCGRELRPGELWRRRSAHCLRLGAGRVRGKDRHSQRLWHLSRGRPVGRSEPPR